MSQRQFVTPKFVAYTMIIIALIAAIILGQKIKHPSNTSIASGLKKDSAWRAPDLTGINH